jgi:radical SAM protein with 4Fe4S-binding SPASM domain
MCNLKCSYCFADTSPERIADELTTEEALNVIDQCIKNKVLEIRFSGGEPFMRKDFFTILEYVHNYHIRTIIQTNGILVNKEIAKKLGKLEIAVVGVSIDGGIAKTHDKSRGVQGSFNKSISGLLNLQAENIQTRINYMVTIENLKEIPKLMDLLPSYEFIDRITLYSIANVGRGQGNVMISLKDSETILSYIDYLAKKFCVNFTTGYGIRSRRVSDVMFLKMLNQKEKTDVEFPVCEAGRILCNIWYNGLVKPCEIWPTEDAVGNIKEDSLADLWQNAPLFQDLRSVEIECIKCPLFNSCGGGCRFESKINGGLESKPISCIHASML